MSFDRESSQPAYAEGVVIEQTAHLLLLHDSRARNVLIATATPDLRPIGPDGHGIQRPSYKDLHDRPEMATADAALSLTVRHHTAASQMESAARWATRGHRSNDQKRHDASHRGCMIELVGSHGEFGVQAARWTIQRQDKSFEILWLTWLYGDCDGTCTGYGI